MTDEKIGKITGYLWGGTFKNIDFNMRQNEINLHIQVNDLDVIMNHNLSFFGVSTFYYINNAEDKRKRFYEMEDQYDFDFTSLNYVENINRCITSYIRLDGAIFIKSECLY